MAHLRSVRITEYRAIQGCNKCIVNVSFLGPRDSVLFIEVSVFHGVHILGFHCIQIQGGVMEKNGLPFGDGMNISFPATQYIIHYGVQ